MIGTRTLALAAALLVAPSALAGTPKASSEHKDGEGVRHSADKAFDGLLQTAWAEGEPGSGEGAWIEIKLDKATPIQSVSIWPGNLASGVRSLREYGRPKTITVELLTSGEPVTKTVHLQDPSTDAGAGDRRVDVNLEGTATAVRVKIDAAYEGGVYNDAYIAEIALNFTRGDQPAAVEAARKYEGTAAAEKAAAKNKDQIVAWFEEITAAEFGSRDILAKIMDQAADGAPFMRDRARNVPYGYRAQAIPPDEVAIEAILKLKDANGIPAIQMASLRVTGKEARALVDKVEIFEAYNDLQSGGSLNVPNWGQSGWEVGALRSFGEPMAVAVDRYGDLYVADVGNHRVQRFDPQGKANKVWGGKADITNQWYAKTRKWYATGAKPGEEGGQFVNPVDIAIVPGKDGDGFAALDAKGRVQVFDGNGQAQLGWTLRTDTTISSGVGGEAFIEFVKGNLVVLWADEAYVYTLDAEEKAHWTIKDGTPDGSVALKNGKLALIFDKELVMYSLDGFRHGNILGDAAALGDGWEDWDVTLDDKGRLWAVTDTGVAVRYKKPGKVDFTVQLTDYIMKAQRIAVYDDLVYVVERDRIRKFDALELKAKAELQAQADEEAEAGL